MTSNLRPAFLHSYYASHPYPGGPRGTIRFMPGPRCARARGWWLEEALEPDGGGGGCTLGNEAANDTANRDWSQPAGGGAIPILFQGDEAPPEKPRAHRRRNTPLKSISYESHECILAALPGMNVALTSIRESMARGCLALPRSLVPASN